MKKLYRYMSQSSKDLSKDLEAEAKTGDTPKRKKHGSISSTGGSRRRSAKSSKSARLRFEEPTQTDCDSTANESTQDEHFDVVTLNDAVFAGVDDGPVPSSSTSQSALRLDLRRIKQAEGGADSKAAGKDASPFEASTTCSEDSPLSPIAESGDALTRIATALGWTTKRGKREKSVDGRNSKEDAGHAGHIRNSSSTRPPKPPKSKFSLWGGFKGKPTDQQRLHRAIGGGSKANIDAVFLELKSAAGDDCPRPSLVLSSQLTQKASWEGRAGGAKAALPSASSPAGMSSPSIAPAPSSATSIGADSVGQRQVSVNRVRSLSIVPIRGQKKPTKIPRLELENSKDWIVEYYKDYKDVLKIEGATIMQNLQVRECDGVTIQLTTKVNNVIVESCKKTNLVLAGLISSVELVHCDKVKLQVLGKCPSVNMDNSSGITLYVGKDGRDVTVTSSKSSDMNICFPTDEAEEDWSEVPIPQQFIHTLNAKNEVESRVSDLYR